MKRLIAILFVATLLAPAALLAEEKLFQPVSLHDSEDPGSRFYVAGIVGASFATLATDQQISANDTLFTTGGAVGMAFDLPPLNGTTSRERIWGWSKPREATNATRKEGTG